VGPEIGEAPRRAPVSTLDTIVALDISQSMAVRDVETDRLHVAQRAIELLGQQLSGGRVGLTLFGGSSVLRYPLTASTKIVGPAPAYEIKGQYQQMLVDANGTQITSRLDEARLVNLATAGGGRYFRYENEGTVKTLSDALRATDMAVATTEGGLSAEDRYQIF